MSKKVVGFEWEGKKYEIEKLRVPQTEDFYSALERLQSDSVNVQDKMRATVVLAKILNCPQAVLDDTAIDEIEPLLDALSVAHFGKNAKGDGGPPESAGNP